MTDPAHAVNLQGAVGPHTTVGPQTAVDPHGTAGPHTTVGPQSAAGPHGLTGPATPAHPASSPGPADPAAGFGPLDALYETDVQTPGSGRTPAPGQDVQGAVQGGILGAVPGSMRGDGHGRSGGDTDRPALQQDTESEVPHRATSPHRAPGPLGADFESIVSTGAFG